MRAEGLQANVSMLKTYWSPQFVSTYFIAPASTLADIISQMLIKHEKKNFLNLRRGAKFFLIAEGVIFFTSYMLYAACNRSQQTRKFFHDTPYLRFVLDFYYKTGKLVGNTTVRDFDQACWSAQKK
jgi:hypothetical protein